jgi:hypothetical protein
MSSLVNHSRGSTARRRARPLAMAAVAAMVVSGVAVATAAPAQARPRSCNNILQSLMFFSLAVEMDTGPSAQYLARDQRMLNYEWDLYGRYGC